MKICLTVIQIMYNARFKRVGTLLTCCNKSVYKNNKQYIIIIIIINPFSHKRKMFLINPRYKNIKSNLPTTSITFSFISFLSYFTFLYFNKWFIHKNKNKENETPYHKFSILFLSFFFYYFFIDVSRLILFLFLKVKPETARHFRRHVLWFRR